MLRGIIDVVAKNAPDQVEPVLRNMASAVGQFSPDMLLGLLERRRDGDESAQLVQSVVSRMTDGTIAHFVARHATADGTATDRLAQAFQTLVRDSDQQQRLLGVSTLTDQKLAGSIMLVEQLLTLGTFIAVQLVPLLRHRSGSRVAAQGRA